MTEIVGAWAADVEPEVLALTDATKALPAGAVFWPTLGVDAADQQASDEAAAGRGRVLVGALMMAGIYAIVTYRWISQLVAGTFMGDPFESFLTLQLFMLLPALWVLCPAWLAARLERRQPDGGRRGVFLLSEHIVFYDGVRFAVLRRAPGRFVAKRRWRPIRRSWDLRFRPGFTEPFSAEVDARAIHPAVAGTVLRAYAAA